MGSDSDLKTMAAAEEVRHANRVQSCNALRVVHTA